VRTKWDSPRKTEGKSQIGVPNETKYQKENHRPVQATARDSIKTFSATSYGEQNENPQGAFAAPKLLTCWPVRGVSLLQLVKNS